MVEQEARPSTGLPLDRRGRVGHQHLRILGGVVFTHNQIVTRRRIVSIHNMNSEENPRSRMKQESTELHIQIQNWLGSLKRKYRVLLLTGVHTAAFMRQCADSTDDLIDRNLLLVDLDSGNTFPAIQPDSALKQINPAHAQILQEHNYCAVLIGKDGTVKKIYTHAPSCREVFELIDTMPMRIDEMRPS